MNRISALNRRYANSRKLTKERVEIFRVEDFPGSCFNSAVRQMLKFSSANEDAVFDNLIGASKALRWLRITQPQPSKDNPKFQRIASEITQQAWRLRGAFDADGLLNELASCAKSLVETESKVGSTLLESIKEVGANSCLVIATSRQAAAGLMTWLSSEEVLVLAAEELERHHPPLEQAYVVGPPRFYRSSLVTAPITEKVTFLLPDWFSDRRICPSVIKPYADGAINIQTKEFMVCENEKHFADASGDDIDESDFLPKPIWGNHHPSNREPSNGEVKARKLILSNNLAMWLDDGERIRSLDPNQPANERVAYIDVPAVKKGTYLLIRQGETERETAYRIAISRLSNGATVDQAQKEWKFLLTQQIQDIGYNRAIQQLRKIGVKAADRVQAWTEPNLIRPLSDQDFESLLLWLGIARQPTFDYATNLRKALHQVSAGISKQLEEAVSTAEISELDSTGFLRLDLKTEGLRGMLATRILAVSPFAVIVPRHEARVPFENYGGRWLE